MKIPAGNSRFLTQTDVVTPIIATMADVRTERLKSAKGEQDKFILFFAGNVKPMVLNPVNRKVLIAAFGDETENWRGKPIEIYVDAGVTMGGAVVGGIRLRLPAHTVRSVTQTFAPAPPTQRSESPMTPHQRLEQVLVYLAQARSRDRVNEIVRHAQRYDWPESMADDIADAAGDRLAELERDCVAMTRA